MPNFAHILSSDRCKTYWTGFTLWPQEHPCYIWCNIIIFDVTLLYLDEDGYKQYPSTTYQQKSYWQVNYSKFHKNIPFFKPGCLKLCCVVQGQFLPEAWGFAMACHRLPDLVYLFFFMGLENAWTNSKSTNNSKSTMLIHLCQMDSSTSPIWTGPLLIKGVSGLVVFIITSQYLMQTV